MGEEDDGFRDQFRDQEENGSILKSSNSMNTTNFNGEGEGPRGRRKTAVMDEDDNFCSISQQGEERNAGGGRDDSRKFSLSSAKKVMNFKKLFGKGKGKNKNSGGGDTSRTTIDEHAIEPLLTDNPNLNNNNN